MKKVLIGLIVLINTTFAFAQSSAIEGNWGTQQSAGGINFDVTFSISHDSTTVTNLCSGFGTTATAHVTVPSSYDDSTIKTLAAAQDQQSSQGLDCNVSAQVDSMHYTIQGNQLILTHDGSDQAFVLTRK